MRGADLRLMLARVIAVLSARHDEASAEIMRVGLPTIPNPRRRAASREKYVKSIKASSKPISHVSARMRPAVSPCALDTYGQRSPARALPQ